MLFPTTFQRMGGTEHTPPHPGSGLIWGAGARECHRAAAEHLTTLLLGAGGVVALCSYCQFKLAFIMAGVLCPLFEQLGLAEWKGQS